MRRTENAALKRTAIYSYIHAHTYANAAVQKQRKFKFTVKVAGISCAQSQHCRVLLLSNIIFYASTLRRNSPYYCQALSSEDARQVHVYSIYGFIYLYTCSLCVVPCVEYLGAVALCEIITL